MEVNRRYGTPGRKSDELIGPTVEERIGADRQSRARLLGEAANAASISPSLLAVSTRSSRPLCCAAARASRVSVSAFGLRGLTSMASGAVGATSVRISTRFAARTSMNRVTPVILPVGWLKLATRPNFTHHGGRVGVSCCPQPAGNPARACADKCDSSDNARLDREIAQLAGVRDELRSQLRGLGASRIQTVPAK
jgi:hypothetical protein